MASRPIPLPHISDRTRTATCAAAGIIVLTAAAAIASAIGNDAGAPPAAVEVEQFHAPAPLITAAALPAPEPVHAAVLPALTVDLQIAQDHTPRPPAYTDDLDGWILEAIDIMAANGIPGSFDGIYRNVMRESSGNPHAINLWDSNAAAGIPSKGLLQVIDPTYAAYHVDGTPFDIWHPVSNIVAACNYAAHIYGSMDNVNGPY